MIVHRILVPDTVEDRIVEMQEKKRQVIESALDESAGRSVARLSTRELAYLFVRPCISNLYKTISLITRPGRTYQWTLRCRIWASCKIFGHDSRYRFSKRHAYIRPGRALAEGTRKGFADFSRLALQEPVVVTDFGLNTGVLRALCGASCFCFLTGWL